MNDQPLAVEDLLRLKAVQSLLEHFGDRVPEEMTLWWSDAMAAAVSEFVNAIPFGPIEDTGQFSTRCVEQIAQEDGSLVLTVQVLLSSGPNWGHGAETFSTR